MASRVLAGLLLLLSALMPVAAAAQPASTSVGISVPAAQVLEGLSRVPLFPGTVQRVVLIVKSNVPWILTGNASGPAGTAAWARMGSSRWERLTGSVTLARGEKGVHLIEVELRRTDPVVEEPATVTLGLGIAR